MSKRDRKLTEKVIGFRFWQAKSGWLESQGFGGHFWGRGTNEAKCEAGGARSQILGGGGLWSSGWTFYDEPKVKKPHHAPENGCTCGLHAYHEVTVSDGPGPFAGEALQVVGAIQAWGRMEVHSNGFRAQYAEVVVLGYNENWPLKAIELVKELARSYEVDCVPIGRLQAFALELGSPVPHELRPGPKEKKETKPVANPVKNPFLDFYSQQATWQIRKARP